MQLTNVYEIDDAWSAILWQTFENISMSYNSIDSQNSTRSINFERNSYEYLTKLVITIGLLLIYLADSRITSLQSTDISLSLDSKVKVMCVTILNVSCFCIIAPILTLILTFFYLYRCIVEILLKVELKDKYAGLLKGTDCVWAVEDDSSLSVINAIAFLEVTDSQSNDLLDKFRKLIKDRLLTQSFEKLSYLRNKKYGYFFWEKCDYVDVEERVRWLDYEHSKCFGTCDDIYGEYLNEMLSKACNRPLPLEHRSSWEILVGRICPLSSSRRLRQMEEGTIFPDNKNLENVIRIPIFFRVHHTVGDGVALLRLLLEAIADSGSIGIYNRYDAKEDSCAIDCSRDVENQCDLNSVRFSICRSSLDVSSLSKVESNVLFFRKDLPNVFTDFAPIFTLRFIGGYLQNYFLMKFKCLRHESFYSIAYEVRRSLLEKWQCIKIYLKSICEKMKTLGEAMTILIASPTCLVQQALRSMDNNALHGPKLTGKKIVSIWLESDFQISYEQSLLNKIRAIKEVTATKFADVVLAALSASLHKYFIQIGKCAPKRMTVVIPTRMTIPKNLLILENQFSVGLLSLCISEVYGKCCERPEEDSKLLERLLDVSRSSEKLRNGPDCQINFWVMKWLSAILPEVFLKPVLESHSTMIFSNLPGPRQIQISGHTLKNIAFWVPHRGTTGIGCSILTYGGNVHLSLIADKAVVDNEKDLTVILKNTVQEINKLYDVIALSCFSKKLQSLMPAPMENSVGAL